jgi:hypothetical protein
LGPFLTQRVNLRFELLHHFHAHGEVKVAQLIQHERLPFL